MKKVIAIVIVLVVLLGLFLLFRTATTTEQPSTTTPPAESNTQNTTPENTDTTNNGTTAPETAPATVQVEIKDFAFVPKELTVKKGTKVTWTNKDSVAHTVTKNADETSGPDSPSIGQDATYSYTFDTVGTFGYFCMPHPQMVATVTVTE